MAPTATSGGSASRRDSVSLAGPFAALQCQDNRLIDRHKQLRIQTRRLGHGRLLSLAIADDASLFVIYGEGGGTILDVAGGAAGVWIPLRGALHVRSTTPTQSVCAREMLVTEPDVPVRAVAHASSRWLAILGCRRAWGLLLADGLTADLQLLPDLCHADRDLMLKAIALVRATAEHELECAVHDIANAIVALQASPLAAIARCPGRTFAQRRQVFLRLQRVRSFMSACCEAELDNEMLARMACYSSCHFLRTFKSVYLETPHSYLVSQRLRRAKRLLHQGTLAVTEVALASGFESRSAFSRLFRQFFGTTAKEARRQSRALNEC